MPGTRDRDGRMLEAAVTAQEQSAEEAGASAGLAEQLMTDDDLRWVDGLRRAGRLGELEDEELLRVASEAEAFDPMERRMELLQLYYDGDDDPAVALRRRQADRFFLSREGELETARGIVARLAMLFPEVQPAAILERVSDAGHYQLRSDDRVSAVFDDEGDDDGTTSLRSLVRAFNRILDKDGQRERLIALRSGPGSEAYIGVELHDAIGLSRAGALADIHDEEIMDLGAW
jgi:hypothetical protein